MGALAVMSGGLLDSSLRAPALGNSFVLFYASGYLAYTMAANINGTGTRRTRSKLFLQTAADVSGRVVIDAILAKN